MKINFPHQPPAQTHYEVEEYKRNIVRIVVVYDRKFDYNNGKIVRCCWGFFDTKTGKFHRPINYKDVGKVIDDVKSTTTAYSGMEPPKKSILEEYFV